MALTAAEEALVRDLLAQQAAILSLAGNEATIISKLGAAKVTLAELGAVSTLDGTELLLARQSTTDKSLTVAILGAYAAGLITLPPGLAYLDIAQLWTKGQAGEITALADGATITPNLSDSNNFSVTLAGNRTLANPTGIAPGQSGVIVVTQDATGTRTLAYGSYYKAAGGTLPVLSTAPNTIDHLYYYVESATRIVLNIAKAVA